MQIVIVLFLPLDLFETASDVAVVFVVIFLQALLGSKAPKLTFGNADTDVHRQNVVNALGGTSHLKIDNLGDIPVHEAVQGTAVLLKAQGLYLGIDRFFDGVDDGLCVQLLVLFKIHGVTSFYEFIIAYLRE
jgi:hypothetical protein